MKKNEWDTGGGQRGAGQQQQKEQDTDSKHTLPLEANLLSYLPARSS